MIHENKKSSLIALLVTIVLLLGAVFLVFIRPHLKKKEADTNYSTQIGPDGTVMVVDKKAVTSFPQVEALGQTYARDANWPKAFECFRQVSEAGNRREWEWSYATATALATGETNACEEYCRRVLDLFGQKTNPDVAERCAKQCLSMPSLSGDLLERAVELADFSVSMGADIPWRLLVKGMAEYRLGHWAEALQWLRKPEDDGRMELAVQAWCFSAMARQQLGDSANARKALEEANRRFKAMVRTGELGDPRDQTWDNTARAVAVRREAEHLIFGKEISPPLDPAAVASGRRTWQPVAKLLDTGNDLGQAGKWREASDVFAQALHHPAFDWEVQELRQSYTSGRMMAAFLMAGEENLQRDLTRLLLDRNPEKLTPVVLERNAQVILCGAHLLPPELSARAVALARLACKSPGAQRNPWLWFVRGMADYHEGRFDQAINSLDRANFRGDPMFQARTLVFRAMACKQLGHTEEATQDALNAATTFAKIRNGEWTGSVFYQVALKELVIVMARSSDSEKNR